MQWGLAVKLWCLETVDKSAEVMANERYVLQELAKSFADRSVSEIDAASIVAHCRTRLDAGRKPRTVNRDLRVLKAVLRAAHRRGDLATVPSIKMLRVPEARVRWISFEQSRALLEHLPFHQIAPVAFALETGLRKRNVARLRWDQVDMERALAWVHADEAKSRKAIAIPLSPTAMAILRGQRDQHPTRVFVYRGEPFEELNTRAYRAAVRAAGLENFTWHSLRHTWASWHLQNGTPLSHLQELGGWSDPEMVKVYAHLSVDHLRGCVAANHSRVRDRHPKGGRRSGRERSD